MSASCPKKWIVTTAFYRGEWGSGWAGGVCEEGVINVWCSLAGFPTKPGTFLWIHRIPKPYSFTRGPEKSTERTPGTREERNGLRAGGRGDE